MKVLAFALEGYREWTESLGYDREWKIQIVQNNLARTLMKVSYEVNAFPLLLRYDYFLVLVDGVTKEGMMKIFNSVKEISPVNVKACLGYGKTPILAQINASYCVNNINNDVYLEDYGVDENVTALHFDLNGFTEISKRDSIYKTYLYITNIYLNIAKKLEEVGGISQYLGGDNIIGFIREEDIPRIIEIIDTKIKVGIGIGRNPRESIKLAAEALHEIRIKRDKMWNIKKYLI
jgi:GTP cyclohydrolase IIa